MKEGKTDRQARERPDESERRKGQTDRQTEGSKEIGRQIYVHSGYWPPSRSSRDIYVIVSYHGLCLLLLVFYIVVFVIVIGYPINLCGLLYPLPLLMKAGTKRRHSLLLILMLFICALIHPFALRLAS